MSKITRRAFLAATTTTAVGIALPARPNDAKVVPGKHSPNELLNIAAVGCGGKGREDVMSCRKENIVALCDVSPKRAGEVFAFFEDTPKFTDYRVMLDKMDKDIDAITVTIPDHMHAPVAYRAMKMGKHVYVQKPLTYTINEARLLRYTAWEMKVATQMGNQGHSFTGARECCEMIWTGAIGPVTAAHAWTNRPTWPQGIDHALPAEPVPDDMDWDLWLGGSADRPYNAGYAPHKWRGWIDFGCGALGDMACHIMDPVFWALKLGDADEFTVECVKADGLNDFTFPNSSVVRYQFPARADMPPCEVTWYDGGNLPERPADIPADQQIGDGDWNDRTNGSLFVGKDGYVTAGEYGTRPRLLPDERMAEYTMPDPILPRLQPANHYRNWIEACKGGEPACSNFDYAAPFTEVILAGTLALRLNRKIRYNLKDGTCPDDPQAQALLTKRYRPGFDLPI